MNNVTRILLMTLVTVIAGATIFFSVWDLPAPADTVERVIDDDRFSK